MKKTSLAFVSKIAIATVFASLFLMVSPALAGDTPDSVVHPPQQALCEGSGGTYSNGTCITAGPTIPTLIRNITNILLFLAGAIAVVMLIIGGIRYVLSAGDQSAITSAKNTILYAVIGVIVVFAAYAIVNFVLTTLA